LRQGFVKSRFLQGNNGPNVSFSPLEQAVVKDGLKLRGALALEKVGGLMHKNKDTVQYARECWDALPRGYDAHENAGVQFVHENIKRRYAREFYKRISVPILLWSKPDNDGTAGMFVLGTQRF
jgi:hypothetical protein